MPLVKVITDAVEKVACELSSRRGLLPCSPPDSGQATESCDSSDEVTVMLLCDISLEQDQSIPPCSKASNFA